MNKPKYIDLKITILKSVRKSIEVGNSRGLCYALILDGCEGRRTPAYRAACRQLQQYIETALEGSAWLDSWQTRNGFGHRSNSQIRKDRLAWIDWMIADYQKWGVK